MKMLLMFVGWVACADAAECTGQGCVDSSAQTSIMQIRRSVLNKRTSADTDDYTELVEMMRAVKMQVGGKAFSEVTPEVMEAIEQMIGLCDVIFEAILSDHVIANNTIETQADALVVAYDESVTAYENAIISDTAVTVCRDDEKAKLIAWEECVADLHLCEEECVTHIQNVSDLKWFDYNIATNYGMEEENTCIFGNMESTGLDAPGSCADYASVTAGYGYLEDDFNAALDKYTDAETNMWTVCNACDETRNTCGDLRVEYLEKHVSCTTFCETNTEKMCLFGYSYQTKCERWDLVEATVESVDYATGSGSEVGSDLSHPDRVAEYNAVSEIKCLLESYREGGTFDEVTECESLTYEERIGTINYQTEKRETSVEDGHVCTEDTFVVTFSGTQYQIGPSSTNYNQVEFTPTATLRPTDEEPFYFCPAGECEVVDVCGSMHSLNEFHSYEAMEAEGWEFNFDAGGEGSFEHDYAQVGYYRGWNADAGPGTLSVTLSGEGAVDVMFGNDADDVANMVVLKIGGIEVAERAGGDVAVSRHDFKDGDVLTIEENDGIILLGYLQFDCS